MVGTWRRSETRLGGSRKLRTKKVKINKARQKAQNQIDTEMRPSGSNKSPRQQVPTPKERESTACLVHETWPKTRRVRIPWVLFGFAPEAFQQHSGVDGPPLLRCLGCPGIVGLFFFQADVTWRSYGAQQLASFGVGPQSRGTVSRTMVRCGEGRAISGGRLLHCVRGMEGRIFAAAIALL